MSHQPERSRARYDRSRLPIPDPRLPIADTRHTRPPTPDTPDPRRISPPHPISPSFLFPPPELRVLFEPEPQSRRPLPASGFPPPLLPVTMPAMPDYRVQLDSYSGPMDLLLYLIRRDEVDIYDIPISHILQQYLDYVRLLERLDPEFVGEFLVLAATLMEIKSRMLLPKPPPEEAADTGLDPRADLVRQLLEYRTFREAAIRLADKAELHAQRFARPGQEIPGGEEEVDLEDVQIWDLLTAFNKLLAAVGRAKATHDVRYDDTPIALHAADVLDRLDREGPTMPFEKIFEGRSRSEMVGLFLALLELIRQKRVRIQQEKQFETIVITLIDATPITTVLDARDETADAVTEPEAEPLVELEVDPALVEDAPLEEVDDGARREALFASEESDDDDDDEFSRRIRAVEVSDVDLGRTPDHPRGPSDPDFEPGSKSESQPDSEPASESAPNAPSSEA